MQREVLAGQAGNDGFGCCQIRTSCFRVWKPKLQKSIWRLTGWPLWLVNGNGRCWPAGAEKECADGLEAWGSGLLTGQDGNKDAACWKMCTSYFRA